MSTKSQIENTIKKILALNNKIRFVAIISDTGKIISCQLNPDKHSLLTKSREEKFCRDIIKRKMMRQEFDNNLGKVRYVNVERENMSQIVTYVNSKSIFVTIEPEITRITKSHIISKIKKISSNLK